MRLFLTDCHLEECRNIREQVAGGRELLAGGKERVAGAGSRWQSSEGSYEIIENGETLSLSREEMQARLQQHFNEAERLIGETGYHRRDGELEELRSFVYSCIRVFVYSCIR